MSKKTLVVVVALFTFALCSSNGVLAGTAAKRITLAGTWQVTRTCASCYTPIVGREVVQPVSRTVFTATGTAKLVLLVAHGQVLVHSAVSSSILKMRTPGEVMVGVGVQQDGTTFKTTWRCIAAPRAAGANTQSARSEARTKARVVC